MAKTKEVLDQEDAKVKREVPVITDTPMSIEKYLDFANLNIKPLQRKAFAGFYRGKILPKSQWDAIISNELTKRV